MFVWVMSSSSSESRKQKTMRKNSFNSWNWKNPLKNSRRRRRRWWWRCMGFISSRKEEADKKGIWGKGSRSVCFFSESVRGHFFVLPEKLFDRPSFGLCFCLVKHTIQEPRKAKWHQPTRIVTHEATLWFDNNSCMIF